MGFVHDDHVKLNLLVLSLTSNNASTIKNTLMLSFLILLKRLTKFLTLSSVTNYGISGQLLS